MCEQEQDLFPDLDRVRAERALRQLAQAGREALDFYGLEDFVAAQAEVDRARRAVRVLDEIRREQKRRNP